MHSLNRLSFLNSEPLNTEHSKRLLIAIPNRNCSTHLVKQSGRKELIIPLKGAFELSLTHEYELRGFAPIGILECWSVGIPGLR